MIVKEGRRNSVPLFLRAGPSPDFLTAFPVGNPPSPRVPQKSILPRTPTGGRRGVHAGDSAPPSRGRWARGRRPPRPHARLPHSRRWANREQDVDPDCGGQTKREVQQGNGPISPLTTAKSDHRVDVLSEKTEEPRSRPNHTRSSTGPHPVDDRRESFRAVRTMYLPQCTCVFPLSNGGVP